MHIRPVILWPAVLFTAFSLFLAPSVQADTIRDFHVDAALDAPHRLLTLTERINYDFGAESKHGIKRYIPNSYSRDGATYRLRLKLLKVWRDGQPEKYSVSNFGGDFSLKVGDPKATLTGVHVYEITYSTDRAINFFSDHDELYWNVTGDKWDAPMDLASLQLTLPAVKNAALEMTCYTGSYGSTEKSCTAEKLAEGKFSVAATRALLPYEGLTVAFSFPKGIFPEPTLLEKIWMLITDNAVLFFPLAAVLVMFLIWRERGRDPTLGSIIPEYEAPKGWAPALLAAAETNGSVPSRAMTATIIDLARRGYLKIRFGEEKHLFGKSQTYTFVKQKDADQGVEDFESKVHAGLFSGGDERDLDDLQQGKFYTSVQSFKTAVQSKIDASGAFVANPIKVRSAYIAVGVFTGFILFLVFGSTLLGAVCAVATGLVVAIFGWFMPRRTNEGVKLLADIRGFKWFLSVTEKDRLDFHNAPERTPEQFMQLLPYAIAFGVENKWAAQFASLTVPPPQWAEGNLTGFSAAFLAVHLTSLHSAATSAAFSPPSSAGSGGSGFSGGGSGGGFGGGGGGSW
ncbi:MAG: DUF2207 domain-containing protein [Patescibacteria group bacterium]